MQFLKKICNSIHENSSPLHAVVSGIDSNGDYSCGPEQVSKIHCLLHHLITVIKVSNLAYVKNDILFSV